MLIDSHCEGTPVCPTAPPASPCRPAIKLGLIRPDFDSAALSGRGARQ
jgi:hypothetical protein